MRRLLVGRPADEASVSFFCAKLGLTLVTYQVAGGVEPLGALLTLDDELAFAVRRRTRRAIA